MDEQGLCSAVSLVVHGEHNNLTIQNNTIWEDVGFAQPGCWGIAVDNGYSDAEGFTNILIQNNTITNVGRVSIGVGACDTCIIENNVISTSQIFSIRAISAPDRSLGPGDLPLNNITVRNNSLYINNAVGGGTGIAVDTMGNNHSIVSNAIYYNGNANNFNCFDYDLPVSDYLDIDYNLCYFPNTLNVEWSNNFGTLSQWQLSSGFSQNSTESNPGFTNPALNQFRAENQNSAMINAGHLSLSSMCDHNCTPRDMQPDIGAYEWVAGDNLFTNGFE